MEADTLSFSNGLQLLDWLRGQPQEWAQVIAIRTALRALPAATCILDAGSLTQDMRQRLVIVCLRATITSALALSECDSDIIVAAVTAAANAAATATEAVAKAKATDAAKAKAAVATAAAAAAAFDIRYAAAEAAADAATYAAKADATWQAVSKDAEWLQGAEFAPASQQATHLLRQPLWHDNAPPSAIKLWETFAVSKIATALGFEPWIRWYEALTSLDGRIPPRFLFSDVLTRRIVTQPNEWWERPAKEINADIAAWLHVDEDSRKQPVPEQALAEALEPLPPQQPAPYLFDWRDGRMDVLPPESLPEDGGIGQDYLNEARDKASDLSERLNGRNFDPNIRRKVGKLLEALKERVADLRPAIVDSRTISVERLASALDNPQDAAELPSDILADLGDLADTARRLCHCLPALWRKDVERLADSLTADSAAALLTQLDALRKGISEAEIVGPEVHAAFATLSEESAEPAADDVKRWRIAMFGLTARNFLTALLKHGTDSAAAVGGELLRLIRDVRRELRPELVKGIAKLVVGGVVTTAVACLFVALLEPASAIAKLFPEIERVVRILESAKPGSGETPAPPQSPPSAPGPRPSRPKSDRDPTRPA